MKAIRLMVSEISSGNETQTHRRTGRYGDDNTPRPTSWAGDKKLYLVSAGPADIRRDTVCEQLISKSLIFSIFLTARLTALEVVDRALLNQCYHPPIGVGRMT